MILSSGEGDRVCCQDNNGDAHLKAGMIGVSYFVTLVTFCMKFLNFLLPIADLLNNLLN